MLPIVAHARRLGTWVQATPRRPAWLSIGLVLGTLGLGAGGCNPQEVEEILGDVRDSPSPPAGTVVPFQDFSDDVGAHGAIETRVLIRSQQGYQDYFGHAPPAAVDFAREWVIFYSAGTRPTGGYDATVVSLTRSGASLLALTALSTPGAGCAVTESLTAPHVLIKFAAQPGATITFNKRDSVKSCSPPDSGCAAILCGPGTHCETHDVVCVRAPCPPIAACVPDAPPVRCGGFAGRPCPGFGRCVDDPSDSCDPNAGGADCGGICQCIQTVACAVGGSFDSSPNVCQCVPLTPPPPVDPCATVRCAAGTHCAAQVVECIAAPCPPVGTCVPDAPPVRCGGIAAFPCPGVGRCIDDPNDSCDPKAGGADCGGICQCVQTAACAVGAHFDSTPAVCACVPVKPPVTCGPVCQIFCENGHVLDANGCQLCSCNPPPTR